MTEQRVGVAVSLAGFEKLIIWAKQNSRSFRAQPLPFDNWTFTCKDEGNARQILEQTLLEHPAEEPAEEMRCNKCHREMLGTTPSDGACECGGLIEGGPRG